MIFGPVNSGEALAATPLIARDKVPMLHPCWVDELIDVKKYPMAFRIAPTNTQIGGGANYYVVDVLKLKKVAVISDTTGYGTASVNTYVPMLKAKGADVVYTNHIDAANPDLKPELLRMQNAGAQVIMPWSVNAGFLSRILQHARRHGLGRADRRPDHARLRPDQGPAREARVLEQGLLEQLPPGLLRQRQAAAARPRNIVERLKKAKIEFGDTLLWWVALGWDGAMHDGRDVQERRHQGRRHRRLLEQGQGLAGHLRHRHLDAGAAQRLPRFRKS